MVILLTPDFQEKQETGWGLRLASQPAWAWMTTVMKDSQEGWDFVTVNKYNKYNKWC